MNVIEVTKQVFGAIGLIIFCIFLMVQVTYLILSIKKIIRGKVSLNKDLKKKSVSILIPAYNEAKVLEKCVQGALHLEYENFEVIFVNDGSTDHSLEVLQNILKLNPVENVKPRGELSYAHVKQVYRSGKYNNFTVIDKENGGKADSLNAGIDYSKGEIIVTLDADSILKEDSLAYMNQAFGDPCVVAAGGAVLAGQMYRNGKMIYPKSFLLKYQLSNYISAFYSRKIAQSSMNALIVVSGAFGAFKSDILREIQGFKKTVGEDMEVTMNMQKLIFKKYKNKKMIFVPEAVCYTEVPERVGDLLKQRIRWQKGYLDCLVRYRHDLFDSFSIPFLFFLLWDSLALGISGSIAVVLLPFTLLFTKQSLIFTLILSSSWIVQYAITMIAYLSSVRLGYVMSKMSYIKLMIFTFFEIFTYRLLDTVAFIYGSISYVIAEDVNQWNKLERTGNVFVK